MTKTMLARAGAVALAATALMAVAPQAPASAAACGDDGATRLFDPVGAYFDFTNAGATPNRDQPFASLNDSGSNGPAGTPPGGRASSDAFDDWGALFVGGTTTADMYFSTDNAGCSDEDGGLEHVYPAVTLHGLQVQRKIYVHSSTETGGLPGARILDLLTNNGTTAVSTTVQVGDDLSSDNEGDLGSDATTAVRASSSGDLRAAAGDSWFVTSDHDDVTANADPALAFVVDGPGALDPASAIELGGGRDNDPFDNLVWRHQVTIAPGETVALMSFVVISDVGDGTALAARADALAAGRAQAVLTAPPAQLYAGMSPAEIADLANWNDLEVTGRLTTPTSQRLGRHLSTHLTCPEEGCTALVSGTLRLGKRSFHLRVAKVTAAAGVATPVTLRLSSKALRTLRTLTGDRPDLAHKARLRLHATISDLTLTAQHEVATTTRIRLKTHH